MKKEQIEKEIEKELNLWKVFKSPIQIEKCKERIAKLRKQLDDSQ